MSTAQNFPAPSRTPSHAERCRTLMQLARHATLCTLAREPKGFPFGSLVAIACDEMGRPLLLLSELAEHTQNLRAAPEASVLVTGDLAGVPSVGAASAPTMSPSAAASATPLPGEGERGARGARDSLALPRATILGVCTRLGEEGVARAARDTFLAAHPEATGYATFKDFAAYRLEPAGVRYVGGFGRMSWVGPADYRAAEPDPLAGSETNMIEHMNDDHPDAVLAYARAYGSIEGATRALMTSIHRYGFDVLAITPDGEQRVHIPFAAQIDSVDDARRALIALVREARAMLASRPAL